MAKCIWCTRTFQPRERGSNIYRLEHAGTTICWDCSDHYDRERIRSHEDSVKAQLHGNYAYTENGAILPFAFENWHTSLLPVSQMRTRAIDSFGKRWRVGWKDGLVTLKPIGA